MDNTLYSIADDYVLKRANIENCHNGRGKNWLCNCIRCFSIYLELITITLIQNSLPDMLK